MPISFLWPCFPLNHLLYRYITSGRVSLKLSLDYYGFFEFLRLSVIR